MEPQEKFISITELSFHLSIKKATLYSWVEQNKIPHLKIHGLIRFNLREINAWLQKLRNQQPRGEKISYFVGGNHIDAEEIVASAKTSVYNEANGKTGPDSCPGKGEEHGTL